ncbi:unnamed protein product [Rotaria sordida]|uniref:Uncharacterized protein n=1 Tax=Rotaria sordida TaxID=392033 RepID=A0A819YCN1_9BILA|nr:unnamed protein product [Rotaria sordida]
MSTAFAVVLRPARVERPLCDRLYNTLHRIENIRIPYVLPNLCLVSLDMPAFIYTDPTIGDITVSKEQWLKEVFKLSSDTLSVNETELLQSRYDYITRVPPKIDAVNLDYLPRSLFNNDQKLHLYTILRHESSQQYFESLQAAIKELLSNGGKRLPGSHYSPLFIRPAELIGLMSDLIGVLNENKMSHADALINRYLCNRFTSEIVEIQIAQFKEELYAYVLNTVCTAMKNRQTPETGSEINETDAKIKQERDRLVTKYLGTMIRIARYQICGLDSSLSDSYVDADQQNKAFLDLPRLIQHEFDNIRAQMNGYQEPELLVVQMRTNLTIEDLRRQEDEQRKLLIQIKKELENKRDLVHRQKRINISLNDAKPVKYGLAPCGECGRRGGAYNIVHEKAECIHGQQGNFYYYYHGNELMVCDTCKAVIKIKTTPINCGRCGTERRVTRIYKYEELYK